ncbi:MAG: hypothetical protein DMD55_00145 [Gemmatimonadetes bacterium]|nr:MAG: hypothetical protein DMD55_00145 [Gemmatimonadota bacterium]
MRRLIGLLGSVALAATARAGAAQWGLSVDVGAARFAGTARDSSGASLGPYRPTTFSVRVDRELGPIRVGVGVMYARTGLAGEQDRVAVVFYDRASLVEVAPAIAIRVACFGAGVVTRVEAGPALDLWDVDDVTRTRVGARGGLGLEWPLGGRFTGSFHATGVLSGSVMNRDEAPAGVERRATRRGSVSIGLGYRL